MFIVTVLVAVWCNCKCYHLYSAPSILLTRHCQHICIRCCDVCSPAHVSSVYTRFVCSSLSLCIVYKYVCLLFQYVCLFVYVFFVVSFLVCKSHSFYYSPEAESATWKATLLSGFLEHCSDGGLFLSDVEGMHESTDGFPVKSIRIYSYQGCYVSLDRGQKLAITGNKLLVDVTDGSL